MSLCRSCLSLVEGLNLFNPCHPDNSRRVVLTDVAERGGDGVRVLDGGPSGKLRLLAKGLGKLATLATSKTFPHPSCETKKGTPSAAPCAFNVLRLTERA